MELLLVRHAQPVGLERASGRADPGLHPDGLEQAGRLAGWLALEGLDAIYTSPALRAQQTAAALAERLGLTAQVLDGLDEFDREETSYVPVEELKETGDPRWATLLRGELYGSGVDPIAFRERVLDTVEAIIREWPGAKVVAVCHGGVINAYVGAILGIDRSIWFGPSYTAVSRVVGARDGRRSVLTLGEAGHLHPAAALG